jgi:hypothetical protein
MSDDEILKLNQASQLLKMNREDAVKKYQNDQNEEASLLKNDVYKLSEGAEGEEKNEIAYLAESMNTDTFNKLAKAKNSKERNKIINSMMANTGISKENRLKMKGMLLNSLQKHQELESRKQEAINGDYQKTALEAMKKSYGKEDMGDQQFLDFLDRTGASEFLANTASDVEDRRFANKEEEENPEETVEVIEGNNAIVNQNTESIEKLTDAINSLTEMLAYQNGGIEAKDLKYQDNINSTKNLADRDIVNQGNYQDVRAFL